MGDDRKVSQMTATADAPPQDRETLENEISKKLRQRPSEPLMQENFIQERAQIRTSVPLEYEARYSFVKQSVSLESKAWYPLTKKSIYLEPEKRYPLTIASPTGKKPQSEKSIQPVITSSENTVEAKPSVSLEPEEWYPLNSTITQPNSLETEDDVKL